MPPAASADEASNMNHEARLIPSRFTERRTGFEPATPSLGSWPRGLERHHGVLALPFAIRPDLASGLPDAPSSTFGMTFGDQFSGYSSLDSGNVFELPTPVEESFGRTIPTKVGEPFLARDCRYPVRGPRCAGRPHDPSARGRRPAPSGSLLTSGLISERREARNPRRFLNCLSRLPLCGGRGN
jgi:hypothetical protein